VDYARLDTSGFVDCIRVQHKKLARAVVKFTGQPQEVAFALSTVAPSDLAAHVHSIGFANPCVVRAYDDAQSALGIRWLLLPFPSSYISISLTSLFSPCSYASRVPEGELTIDRVAELVGRNRQVNTIDVSTQVHTFSLHA
jgi:hypothetical protein